jgi:hypothetical protein
MKKTLITICSATVLFAACNNAGDASKTTSADSVTATTTEPTKDEKWVPVDSATAMKAWMDFATPGEQHKALAKSDGKWTAETSMWMEPDKPAMTSTGESTNKMILGGRYQMSEHKGSFMGMPFEGVAITGYDNHKKKYVSTWIDNMGTGIMQMEGTWDDGTKTMTMEGKMEDITREGKYCEMKETLKMVDDDHMVMEMYGPDNKTGKQYKTMEIKYTRKK